MSNSLKCYSKILQVIQKPNLEILVYYTKLNLKLKLPN